LRVINAVNSRGTDELIIERVSGQQFLIHRRFTTIQLLNGQWTRPVVKEEKMLLLYDAGTNSFAEQRLGRRLLLLPENKVVMGTLEYQKIK